MKIQNYNLHQLARYASVSTAASTLVLSLASCEVKKTEDGKAPTVTVEEGKLPKYDVETAKVDVTAQKKEITVPKVTTEQKTITVPDVNITMPGDKPVTGSPAPDAEATATVTPAP